MRFDDGCLDSATCYKLSQALLTGAGFFFPANGVPAVSWNLVNMVRPSLWLQIVA